MFRELGAGRHISIGKGEPPTAVKNAGISRCDEYGPIDEAGEVDVGGVGEI